MGTIDVRIRIAILWALWAATATFSVLLWLLVEPAALEKALAGGMEGFASDGGVGYFLAISSGIVPMALAVMTLQFDSRGMRYANLVAGLMLGGFTFVDLGYSFVDGAAFNASVLVSVSSALISFLIAGLSAAALRRGTPGRPASTHEVIEPQHKTAP